MSSIERREKGNGPRRKACAPCRTRRIRCNRMQPCNNCMIRGLRCLPSERSSDSPSTSSSSSRSKLRAAITAPGSDIRKAGFHRFIIALDVYLANVPARTNAYIWRHGIIPAAVNHEAMMNVILSKEIINTLNKEQLLCAALPPKAIEYYVDSLSRPFTRLEDLLLLLMISILYIEIECTLSHYQNLDILVQTTFRIIYSNLELIKSRYLKDILFFCVLGEFFEHVTESSVDVSAIPLEIWTEVHGLALQSARKMQVDALMLMEMRLYELNFLSQRSDFDASTFGWKLAIWEHEMTQLRRMRKHPSRDAVWLNVQERRAHPAKLFWNAYLYHASGETIQGEKLRSLVEDSVKNYEAILHAPWVNSPDKIRVMHVQVHTKIIPRVAVYVSYARDVAICQRLLKVLDVFRPCITYFTELRDYLMTVAQTEFGQHTALELAYLGFDLPLILWRWQLHRVVDQVASRGMSEFLNARSLPIMQPGAIV